MLRLSVERLAENAGLSAQTLSAIEATDGTVGDNFHGPAGPIRRALEAAGIEFIDEDDDGGAGVRLSRPRRSQEGIRPENLTAANDD
jgi:hypothetical protein